ncbi:MAG: hypothetical protein Q8Q36_02700 [bacterium]|nr:hypothetical protein [bacterium]
MDEELLYWEVHEYEPSERDPEWFWVLGVIVASVSIAAILLGNIYFGILILLAGIILAYYARRGPSLMKVRVTGAGIMVHDRLHPFGDMVSFSIDRDLLIIERTALWHPLLIIPMGREIPAERVRSFFAAKLPEKEHKEPLSHRVMDRLGF